MKLNEEWDRVYRHATAELQQRLESLVQETAAAKQLNKRLLLRVENQQVKTHIHSRQSSGFETRCAQLLSNIHNPYLFLPSL